MCCGFLNKTSFQAMREATPCKHKRELHEHMGSYQRQHSAVSSFHQYFKYFGHVTHYKTTCRCDIVSDSQLKQGTMRRLS